MAQDQAQKQKEAIGRRQFNISPSEKLIDQLSCKYKSKLKAGGALWVFHGHFCYYSNLFGTETKIRLRISEISKIIPCGNSSVEITTKTNEMYKFVAFPSKEKRESVIKFITESANKLKNHSFQSPPTVLPKQPQNSMKPKRLQSQSVDGTDRPDDSLLKTQKTTTIHPRRTTLKPAPPVPLAPSKPKKSTASIAKSEGHTAKHTKSKPVNASNMRTDSEQATHTNHKLNPSRLLTHESYGTQFQSQRPINSNIHNQHHEKRKRTKSSGIDYNNPPNFRLQSIHSQQSLRLSTPQIHSDSDNDVHDSRRSSNASKTSNKDAGAALDTMDIMNLHDRRWSIHSDETHGNRARSWSDSDMPRCEDPKVIKYDRTPAKKTNQKPAFGSAAWFDNIFKPSTKPSHSSKSKKKTNAASASLSSIQYKSPMTPNVPRAKTNDSCKSPMTPNMPRAKTDTTHHTPSLPVIYSNTLVNKAQSVPEDVASIKEEKESDEASASSIPPSVMQYIDETHSKTSIHLGEFEGLEYKTLYSDTIWTNPATFFHCAWSSSFLQNMHDDRGSTDLKIGEWSLENDASDQPKIYMRKVEYISKIKDPPPFIAPKTEVYETQRFRFYGSKLVALDVAISTPNVKFGDYFLIINRYILSADQVNENKTHLEISIAFKWIKKTWFEKIITAKAVSEATEGMQLWGRKLRKIFPPKIRKEEIEEEEKDNVISPRRRVIDKKVIDYFHTPQKKPNVLMNEWVKPCVDIIVDIVRCVMDPSSWKNLFNGLMEINATDEELRNICTIKHVLMALSVLMAVIILCNMCWLFMWLWASSSLNNVIRQQNEILQAQNEIFKDLLIFLKRNDMKMLGNGIDDDC